MQWIEKHQNALALEREMIFFDDFTSEELDRTQWNVEVTGEPVNNEQQAYIDSPETIYINPGNRSAANGTLVIHPKYQKGTLTDQGKIFDFVSGRINTREKMEFTFGCVSARIKLSCGAGLWPAFWVLGTAGQWPKCGEIDVMENVGEPDWAGVAIHGPGYFGETPLVNKKFFSPSDSSTNWHVYSFECSETQGLLFKIDGDLIYRVTRPMIEFYGSWVFSTPKYLILNFALGGTYPFKTNGVQFPYYGLPESTVRSIQNNEAKMWVDWVKVTRSG